MAASKGTVCVTGANGFIASHIVAQLLEKGYTVHATVRDPSNPSKVDHLKALPGGKERIKFFKADLSNDGDFDAPVAGCMGVIHVATPLSGGDDGENQIFKPGINGVKSMLSAITKAGTVKTFVLTSSMSAVAPKPEPPIKNESHWSDDAKQKASGNWYGACKTCQEKAVLAFIEQNGGKDAPPFRYAAICPTGVFGPMLQPNVNRTMGWMLGMAKNGTGGKPARNDSMSFIDVRDTAAQHVAALELESASGRYMSVVESLHWNDIYTMLKQVYPPMGDFKPCEGEPVKPTQFDLTKMNSLGVSCRSVRDILEGAVADLQAKGALPSAK